MAFIAGLLLMHLEARALRPPHRTRPAFPSAPTPPSPCATRSCASAFPAPAAAGLIPVSVGEPRMPYGGGSLQPVHVHRDVRYRRYRRYKQYFKAGRSSGCALQSWRGFSHEALLKIMPAAAASLTRGHNLFFLVHAAAGGARICGAGHAHGRR